MSSQTLMDGKKQNILITGTTSRVGRAFSKYVEEHYPDCYGLEYISLRDSAFEQSDFSKYDAILHIAGITQTDTKPLSASEEAQYYRVNRDITLELAKKAKREGVSHLIYLSTMMVYGNSAPIGRNFQIGTDTKPEPACVYGKSKLQGEAIRDLETEDFKVCIVREPILYGEDFQGEFYKLMKLAKAVPFFPYTESRKSYLYQGNLCELIHLLIKNKYSGIVCPQNRELPTTSELYEKMARLQGKKCFVLKGFTGLLKLCSHISPLVNAVMNDMTYEESLSQLPDLEYRIYSLEESIKRCL